MVKFLWSLAFWAIALAIPDAPAMASDCSTPAGTLRGSALDPCLLHGATPPARVHFEPPMLCVPYTTVVGTGVGYYALRTFDPSKPIEPQLRKDNLLWEENVVFAGSQRDASSSYVCRNVDHFKGAVAVVLCDELGFSGAVMGEPLMKALREGWRMSIDPPYTRGWTPVVPLGTEQGRERWLKQRGAAIRPPP